MIITTKLKSLNTLSKSEKILANYILNQRENIKNSSTKDLADATYTSAAAVIRLSKKLGFSGWCEFKEQYLEEVQYMNKNISNIDANFPFQAYDTFMSVASKITQLTSESLTDTLLLLKNDELKKAANLLHKSRKINVYGISNSLISAYDFKNKMLAINRTVEIVDSVTEQVALAANSTPNDCAILVSYSGESSYVLKVAKLLSFKKTPMIVLTSIGENSLKAFGSCLFSITTKEKLYSKIGTFSSNSSVRLILDILYSCLFKMDYDCNLEYKIRIAKIQMTDLPLANY